MKKNDEYTVIISDLTYEGMGVGKIDNFPLFIEDALPGEEAVVKVLKVSKHFGYAKVVERKTTSPDRVAIRDKVGTRIGTMPLQHLSYPAQLTFKQEQVKQVMRTIAKLPDVPVRPTIGMTNPWEYRNKAQIPVRKVGNHLVTGFFKKNSHEVLPVENFYIQDPMIDQAIVKVRNILDHYGVKAYNETAHIGNLRHIIVRRGHYSHQIMIILVTRTHKLFPLSKIVPDILESLPETVSIIQNVQPHRSNKIMGEETIVLYGEDVYQDQLMGLEFMISSKSFYQVNTLQAEVLYQEALKAADLTGEETVIDAYCGIGTISLALAKHAKKVYAMEIIPDAIQMAHANAKRNQISNVHFEVGAAEAIMPQWKEAGIRADVVLVDPPRKGLDKEFIEAALATQPDKIVYVSCNPATMARDLALFVQGGYQVHYVQPVDMFPQTVSVETVALLSKPGVDKHLDVAKKL